MRSKTRSRTGCVWKVNQLQTTQQRNAAITTTVSNNDNKHPRRHVAPRRCFSHYQSNSSKVSPSIPRHRYCCSHSQYLLLSTSFHQRSRRTWYTRRDIHPSLRRIAGSQDRRIIPRPRLVLRPRQRETARPRPRRAPIRSRTTHCYLSLHHQLVPPLLTSLAHIFAPGPAVHSRLPPHLPHSHAGWTWHIPLSSTLSPSLIRSTAPTLLTS
jgi:hypothetical protein